MSLRSLGSRFGGQLPGSRSLGLTKGLSASSPEQLCAGCAAKVISRSRTDNRCDDLSERPENNALARIRTLYHVWFVLKLCRLGQRIKDVLCEILNDLTLGTRGCHPVSCNTQRLRYANTKAEVVPLLENSNCLAEYNLKTIRRKSVRLAPYGCDINSCINYWGFIQHNLNERELVSNVTNQAESSWDMPRTRPSNW